MVFLFFLRIFVQKPEGSECFFKFTNPVVDSDPLTLDSGSANRGGTDPGSG
jgi:hypothetical protein